MHAEGVVTRVIGFGETLKASQLVAMADWGSGGTLDPIVAKNQDQLEVVLAGLLAPPVLDPCCSITDCSIFVDTDGDIIEPEPSSTGGDTSSTEDPSSTGGDTSSTGDASSTGGDSRGGDDTAPVDPGTGTAGPDSTGLGESGPADPDSSTGPESTSSVTTSGAPEPTVPTSGGPGPADPGATDSATASATGSDDPPESGVDVGCGCRTTSFDGAPALLLLGLLGRRRRRR